MHDECPYLPIEEVDQQALPMALCSLEQFGSDPYLRMQATNFGLVDTFLMKVEENVLQLLLQEERTPLGDAAFLSAQSQMWIFAVYEALRTWRQRAREILTLSEKGQLERRISELEADLGYENHNRKIRSEQLKRVLVAPDLLDVLKRDLRRVHVPFRRIEALRMMLAKHEEKGRRASVAQAPGYGRINRWCGAIDFELSVGAVILGNISRRDIADEVRVIGSCENVPSDEDLRLFDEMMKGPQPPEFS